MSMKTLAVTGGIGSGKSAVCDILVRLGFPVYDSDRMTKAMYASDAALVSQIVEALKPYSTNLLLQDGKLDKEALATVLFNDNDALDALETVVHPVVLRDFEAWIRGKESKYGYVIMESALILERPLFSNVFDCVLLVDAPLDLRVGRAMRRDGASEEEVRARMRMQPVLNSISLGEVEPVADFVLMNDSTLEVLAQRVDDFVNEVCG